MVVLTGTCYTIVRPDIVKHCGIIDTGAKFILEAGGGETMPVLGIHEAKIKYGQHEFGSCTITDDDTLMGDETT